MGQIKMFPSSFVMALLADDSYLVAVLYKKYDRAKGWLLALEYTDPSARPSTRQEVFSHDGRVVWGRRANKAMVFNSPEDIQKFLNSWTRARNVKLGSLTARQLVEISGEGSSPKLLQDPQVKATNKFMARQDGWEQALGGSYFPEASKIFGRKIASLWSLHPVNWVVVFDNGSWVHVSTYTWDAAGEDYKKERQGRDAAALAKHWGKARFYSSIAECMMRK